MANGVSECLLLWVILGHWSPGLLWGQQRVLKDSGGRIDSEQGCLGCELFLWKEPGQLEPLSQMDILHGAGPRGETTHALPPVAK